MRIPSIKNEQLNKIITLRNPKDDHPSMTFALLWPKISNLNA